MQAQDIDRALATAATDSVTHWYDAWKRATARAAAAEALFVAQARRLIDLEGELRHLRRELGLDHETPPETAAGDEEAEGR